MAVQVESAGRAPAIGEAGANSGSERDKEPLSKDVRLVREAASTEHRPALFPKFPACHMCSQARMCRKKAERLRQDPLSDRGALPPVEEFGESCCRCDSRCQRLAKAKDGAEAGSYSSLAAESTVLVVRVPLGAKNYREYSWGFAIAHGQAGEEEANDHVQKVNERELEAACQQLGCVSEPTLANRWPHSSVLERDVWTLEKVAKAVHLQSGFQIRGLTAVLMLLSF